MKEKRWNICCSLDEVKQKEPNFISAELIGKNNSNNGHFTTLFVNIWTAEIWWGYPPCDELSTQSLDKFQRERKNSAKRDPNFEKFEGARPVYCEPF